MTTPREAGAELDAMIAEKVMGLGTAVDLNDGGGPRMWSIKAHGSGPGSGYSEPKPYSTDIAAAWQVVEKMKSEGWSFAGFDCIMVSSCPHPCAAFKSGVHPPVFYIDPFVHASTIPLAISLAALAAVGK